MTGPLLAGYPGLPRRVASALQRLGWKGLVARCYRRGPSLLVRRHSDIVLCKDLAENDTAPPGTLLQVSAFDGGAPDFLDGTEAWDEEHRDLLRVYVSRGYRALFAHLDGRIVGHMWWTDGPHPHLARYGVRLGPHEAWAFNFFLDPRYRGGGNANVFLARLERHLRSRGFRRVWGVVASENKPARWLYSLCDWRPVKVVNAVELAGGLLLCRNGAYVRNSRRKASHDYRRIASWHGARM